MVITELDGVMTFHNLRMANSTGDCCLFILTMVALCFKKLGQKLPVTFIDKLLKYRVCKVF